MIEVKSQTDLPEIAQALGATGRLSSGLNGRQQHADKRADEATTVLGDPAGGDFEIERQELRGDILKSTGDAAGAIAAYERTIELAKDSGGVRLVELKLQELRITQPATTAPAASSATAVPAVPVATPAKENTP